MRATAALRRLLASRSAPVARSDIFSASYELAHTARRVVAPYEVAAVNGTRASGVASIPLTLTRQMGGSRKASLTLARAARPEGRGGDSQEAGGTLVPPPLVRSVAAQATFPPVKYEHTFALSGEHLRARTARPYGV